MPRHPLLLLLLLLLGLAARTVGAPRLQQCQLFGGGSEAAASCALRLDAGLYHFSFCLLPAPRADGLEAVPPELDFSLHASPRGDLVHAYSLYPHQRAGPDAPGCSYGSVEEVALRAGGAYTLSARCQPAGACGPLQLHATHISAAPRRPPRRPATVVLTACGAAGRSGPSAAACAASYAARPQPQPPLAYAPPPGAAGEGWQTLTLAAGTYRVVAGGASGIGGFFSDRCRGAVASARVALPAGARLHVLVGQKGGASLPSLHSLRGASLLRPMAGDSGGGGGATHVLLDDGSPLLVAGGGGGMLGFRYNAAHEWCDAGPVGRGPRPGVQTGFSLDSQPVRVPRLAPGGEPQCCSGGGLYARGEVGDSEGSSALAGGLGGPGYAGPWRECPAREPLCAGHFEAAANWGGFGGGGGGGGGGGAAGGPGGAPARECFADRCSFKAAFGGGGSSYCRAEAPAAACADEGYNAAADGYVTVTLEAGGAQSALRAAWGDARSGGARVWLLRAAAPVLGLLCWLRLRGARAADRARSPLRLPPEALPHLKLRAVEPGGPLGGEAGGACGGGGGRDASRADAASQAWTRLASRRRTRPCQPFSRAPRARRSRGSRRRPRRAGGPGPGTA